MISQVSSTSGDKCSFCYCCCSVMVYVYVTLQVYTAFRFRIAAQARLKLTSGFLEVPGSRSMELMLQTADP